MNRCEICDKTDEDDPKANIAIRHDSAMCYECFQVIQENIEDLTINEDEPLFSSYGKPITLPRTVVPLK